MTGLGISGRWKTVVIAQELYEKAAEYYQENKEELKLRHGIRSLTAYINYCIREYFKDNGII